MRRSTSLESMNSKDSDVAVSETRQVDLKGKQITLIYLFCVTILLRLWFNFATDHINSATASDASEYLRYATAISNLNWLAPRSEDRRVGKECRSRWSP